jgi:hypothetical protein
MDDVRRMMDDVRRMMDDVRWIMDKLTPFSILHFTFSIYLIIPSGLLA